jgi:hypothetical protein
VSATYTAVRHEFRNSLSSFTISSTVSTSGTRSRLADCQTSVIGLRSKTSYCMIEQRVHEISQFRSCPVRKRQRAEPGLDGDGAHISK